MSAEDYMPMGMMYHDDFDEYLRDGGAYCRHCGAQELTWDQLPDGRWRLLNPSGRVHHCKPFQRSRVSSPDDFDDLTKESKP